MRQISNTHETPSARLMRDIRRATRKQYSAEEKVRIVLDTLRGEVTIAELRRQEGIADAIHPTKRAVDNVSRHKGMNSSSR